MSNPVLKKRATPRRTLVQVSVRKPTATSKGLWPSDGEVFDRTCTLCPRLANFLKHARLEEPEYYNAPVAPFGDPKARFVIVGLAPGFHGANASGRPFTGDHAGVLLYRTLHRYGFANKPVSIARDDGLQLLDCRITNSVKCVPPENKPLPIEIQTCNRYLKAETRTFKEGTVLLALGLVGHNALLRALGLKPAPYKFAHAAEHDLPNGLTLIDSYHCSRYNTQTGRLTDAMFEAVFARARELLDARGRS